jgi:hypothetical protein
VANLVEVWRELGLKEPPLVDEERRPTADRREPFSSAASTTVTLVKQAMAFSFPECPYHHLNSDSFQRPWFITSL